MKTDTEASRGAAAQSVTVKPTGCGFDPLSRRWNIYLNLYLHFFALVSRQSAALSSATQHAMSPEFYRKCDRDSDRECLNTILPLPTLLYCVRDTAWSWFFIKTDTALAGFHSSHIHNTWQECIKYLLITKTPIKLE